MSAHGRVLLLYREGPPQRPLLTTRSWVWSLQTCDEHARVSYSYDYRGYGCSVEIVCLSQETALPGLNSSGITRATGGYGG